MDREVIILEPDDCFPCEWTDLFNIKTGRIYATVYTLDNTRSDYVRRIKRTGITKGEDSIFYIVFNVPELEHAVVRNALKDLAKITNKEYYLI